MLRRAAPSKRNEVYSKENKVDPSSIVLAKPFSIPIKRRQGSTRRITNVVSYNEESIITISDESKRRKMFSAKDVNTVNSMDLQRSFKLPFRSLPEGYDANGPPPVLGTRRRPNFIARPLHDPCGEFAIVLYDPTIPIPAKDTAPFTLSQELNPIPAPPPPPEPPKKSRHKSLADILGIKDEDPNDRPKVPVVLDPRLAKVLRPHQIEGVQFLYKCTTGQLDENAYGCIMADEMGLGKTLQCIALCWTLLKQSPIAGKSTISKCIIVCPSSLVKNWANEFDKWLGKGTVTPFAVDGSASKTELIAQIHQWCTASGRSIVRPALIISYETLRLYSGEFGRTEIGLMLCDEGHRLKNGDSLTFTALTELNVKRRVILSGTPIQNDLSEYFSLITFANPGLLGSRLEFRKNYELAILRGRDANCTEKEREIGEQKLTELNNIVSKFIIRRTNDLLTKYLPVKYEHVVFCNLSPFQLALYKHFLESPAIKRLLKGKEAQPLKLIGQLRKLCNHPDLLKLPKDVPGSEELIEKFEYIPPDLRGYRDNAPLSIFSGKFQVLERMLYRIRRDTDDKIVLISNFTQTLDLLEKFCKVRKYGALRLDGTMSVNKRQKLVDRFNDPQGEEFVFLLSSKAGGCGINLIGANRLILFDPDWNPAADQQALARVWRDGQKKDCFVYRFVGTGTIEENVFQRQSMKQSLSSCVVDNAQDVERFFALDDLRLLFRLTEESTSTTHETFKCKRCDPDTGEQRTKAEAILYGDTSSWNHFTNHRLQEIEDKLLQQESGEDVVSFAFQYISH
ncbi:hypothetical protein CANCADRAFT_27244 [Tortispora caseinolytica NRRL Y-17796]|uniref:DNA repair and recombination protein RAD54 n=1 Tax=Tortispora caseinolytica NRRL Y-17796 TaxID=767744 RepID=A0A1E4TBN9_9ASCO|nr:hypothetical protein CANCADRAFT_27244 [Tortispora caseinolytica NRRL Y-17796]